MKLAFAITFVVGIGLARAEDPMPVEEPVANETPDDPGVPGENEPVEPAEPAPAPAEPAPAPEPAPARTKPRPARRARLAASSGRSIRTRARDDGGRLHKTEDIVQGGRHWRIESGRGAIHVWVPRGYERDTAGTVVYVHGYWIDADRAWKEHKLARQFRQSRQNAMFIVPDAPASREQGVHWPALADLRRAVTRANIRLPDGPVIVMGHSGAFRTVMQWVDHRHVAQIILLDAMYAGERKFDEFISSGKRADQHKLIVVGADVAASSAAFAKRYRFAVAREKVPSSLNGFSRRERRAKLLYIHSQYSHYPIVTSRKVIPVLLRLTRLKRL